MFNFSYTQEKYDEVKEPLRYYLNWTNIKGNFKYKDCVITVIGMGDERKRIIVRRKIYGESKFLGSKYEVHLMLGFITSKVEKKEECNKNVLSFELVQSEDIMHRDLCDVQIWGDTEQETDELLDTINQKTNKNESTNIIQADYLEEKDSIVPVIYQPRVDTWENFLREVHVHKDLESNCYKITLAFQDEDLRKHRILNGLYRLIRLIKYKRTVDIETFSIKNDKFYFKDIYSGESNLFEDTIHNEKNIAVKYYFQNKNHPVIFVNTSNHAIAPHDNNHDLWKFEYVPWSEKSPVKLGTSTRKEVENSFKRI